MRRRNGWGVLGCLGLGACLAAWPAAAAAQVKNPPSEVAARPAPPPRPLNKIGIEYEYERFNHILDPWHWVSVEYAHRFDWGSLLGRVNWADRFNDTAFQYEVDAYPKLWKGAYLYLNAGVAQQSFFPDRRYGAELFWSLPRRFEASVGYRRLVFEPRTVHLYTGSLGWYHGNWYTALRPWVSNKPGDTSVSGGLLVRRYFATADDYCTLRAGGGQASDFDQTIDQLLLSSQWYVIGEWQRKLHRVWIVKAKAGYRNQKFETGVDRRSWLAGGGLARLF